MDRTREYGYLDVINPFTGEILAQVPLSTKNAVDQAIDITTHAFSNWSSTPVSRRVRYSFEFNEVLRSNEEKLARVMLPIKLHILS